MGRSIAGRPRRRQAFRLSRTSHTGIFARSSSNVKTSRSARITAPKGEKYVLDDERTFANLAQKTRPNAEAAVVLAYKMKGPCTTKAALEYARALPDPASIGSLKRADAVLKRAGIVITESVRMARDRTKAVADIESLYQERIHLDHKVLG